MAVLIIDDDVELCELVGEYLEGEGFEVESVHDGVNGVDYAMLANKWLWRCPATVVINEFMADNKTTIEDPDQPGAHPDWIEIYNPMLIPFDLGGMYLTDDQAIPTKYQIPDGVSIGPGGYLLFWADNDPEQGPAHTNFKLNATDGEVISLTDIDGTTVIDSIVFGPQTSDISYGRLVDGTENQGLLETPTPGTTNGEGI